MHISGYFKALLVDFDEIELTLCFPRTAEHERKLEALRREHQETDYQIEVSTQHNDLPPAPDTETAHD